MDEITDSNVISAFQKYCSCTEDACLPDCRVCPMMDPEWNLCLHLEDE